MATHGAFDSLLIPAVWLDESAIAEGWFDSSLITTAAGGAATYNDALLATISASDSLVSVGVWPNAVAASVSTNDTLTAGLLFSAPLGESIALTDSIAPGALFASSIAASVTTADSLAAVATLPNAISEAVALAFVPIVQMTLPNSISATVATGSSFLSTQLFFSILTEGVSLLATYDDALVGGFATYNEVLNASLAVADALIAAQTFSFALTEQVTLSDGATTTVIVAETLAEAIAAAAALEATQIVVTSIGEALVLTAEVMGGMLVWPAPADVLLGVQYGPSGSEYTGSALIGSGGMIVARHANVVTTQLALRISARSKRQSLPEPAPSIRRSPQQQPPKQSKYAYAVSAINRLDVFTATDETTVWQTTKTISI